MKGDNKSVNINIRIEKDMKNKLEKLAQANNRGLSDFIRLALQMLIDKKIKF